jgi:hypothetical protein
LDSRLLRSFKASALSNFDVRPNDAKWHLSWQAVDTFPFFFHLVLLGFFLFILCVSRNSPFL